MGLGFGLLSAQLRPGETDWTRAYDETVSLAVEPLSRRQTLYKCIGLGALFSEDCR